MVEIKEVQSLLETLNDNVEQKSTEATFLDIINRSRKENDWSDIYHFFMKNDYAGLKSIIANNILSILKNRVGDASKKLPTSLSDNYEVQKEVRTKKATLDKKRIDLLICDRLNRTVIIIENKVDATLCNPLDTYHSQCERQYPDCDIYPVVLSLKKHIDIVSESGIKWHNITHLELMNSIHADTQYKSLIEMVMANLTNHYQQYKHVLLFDEFVSHVIKQTNMMNKEALSLCIKHQNEIVAAHRYYKDYKEHVIAQVNRACKTFARKNSFEHVPKDEHFCRYLKSTEHPGFCVTVLYGGLLHTEDERWVYGKIQLIIELQDAELIEAALRHKEYGAGELHRRDNAWAHLQNFEVDVDENNIENLDELILENLTKESKVLKALKIAAKELASPK